MRNAVRIVAALMALAAAVDAGAAMQRTIVASMAVIRMNNAIGGVVGGALIPFNLQ
jgi:hypothetical protein